jgi:hypothetical protein
MHPGLAFVIGFAVGIVVTALAIAAMLHEGAEALAANSPEND